MKDKFLRLIQLIRVLPRQPHALDVETIAARLAGTQLEDVTRRTIERDLVELERMQIGIVRDETSKTHRWSAQRNVDSLLVPALDPHAALALLLVRLHMKGVVPLSTLRSIEPALATSQQSVNGKALAQWTDKVRLVSRTQPLLPPRIDDALLDIVQEAVLKGRLIDATYRKRNSAIDKTMCLHPYGLLFRDALVYLVARVEGFDDTRTYPLHRFVSATLRADAAHIPADFDLDAFLQRGDVSMRLGATLDVVLRFTDGAGRVVVETPLSADQVVEESLDGSGQPVHVVRAQLVDTRVLRAWILGFGAAVEVLAPASLRAAIAASHVAAAGRYTRA